MLPATQEQIEQVTNYMRSQAPELTVQLVQKMYSENVLNVTHDVWDVHTDINRWWVITEPMNLYAQDQFPNMDLALTFHIGLCLRLPRGEQQKLSELPVEPFAECFRNLREASDSLSQAQEVADYQAIGMRCRETLLAFIGAAQAVIPWTEDSERPKKADLTAWSEFFCSVALSGPSHEHRRHLFKTLLECTWKFTNWLTHSKSSFWHDAEAAIAVTENAVGLCTSAIIQHVRGVPAQCPDCGSHRLSPERGHHEEDPDILWERPICNKCDWTGEPVKVMTMHGIYEQKSMPPEGACIIPTLPLRKLKRPTDR